MDAPELSQPCGVQARDMLATLLTRRPVMITSEHGVSYRRRVVSISAGYGDDLISAGGCDVGMEMIRRGLAWYDPRYAPNRGDYAWEMLIAAANRRSLWADEKPIPPWKWRRLQSLP